MSPLLCEYEKTFFVRDKPHALVVSCVKVLDYAASVQLELCATSGTTTTLPSTRISGRVFFVSADTQYQRKELVMPCTVSRSLASIPSSAFLSLDL